MVKHFISLGAGWQSSTVALMAACGEIQPMPDGAIFADTQAEPRAVYEWLDFLCTQLPFPVHRVTAGNLREVIMKPRKTGIYPIMPLPVYSLKKDGRAGGLLNRSCTRDYKIIPINRKLRELIGLKPRQRAQKVIAVNQWIGISIDEISRMKPSREVWIEHRWPLIEAGMSRKDCGRWLTDRGFPIPPKSSCTFCPYHSDKEWASLTKSEFLDSIAVDELIRNARPGQLNSGSLFLHRSRLPLADVTLNPESADRQLNMFENECEGMCGV